MGKKRKKTRVQKIAAKVARAQRELDRQWAKHEEDVRNHPEKYGYKNSAKGGYIEDVVYENKSFERDHNDGLYLFFIGNRYNRHMEVGAIEFTRGLERSLINELYSDFAVTNPTNIVLVRLNDDVSVEQAKSYVFDDDWSNMARAAIFEAPDDGGAWIVDQRDFMATMREYQSYAA